MRIRAARLDDAAAIDAVLARAYPALMASSYDADLLAAALPAMVKARPALLQSGTYYVAEDAGRLIGCGGWSFEEPGSRRLENGLAHLHHFTTDPAMVRRGVGRAIIARCLAMATARAVTCFEAFASLNAEPFYQSLGLERLDRVDLPMAPGTRLPAVRMRGSVSAMEHRLKPG